MKRDLADIIPPAFLIGLFIFLFGLLAADALGFIDLPEDNGPSPTSRGLPEPGR